VGCVLAACIVVKNIPQLWNYNGDEAIQDYQVSTI
jgi:hypothetical protein